MLLLFENSYQALALGELLALLVDGRVLGFESLFEEEEILVRVPPVNGQVSTRAIGVAQQLGSVVCGAAAEQLRPKTFAVVEDFEVLLTPLADVELPNDVDHAAIVMGVEDRRQRSDARRNRKGLN